MNNNQINEFLREKFVNDEEKEWVDISIVPISNIVDITIVSDLVSNRATAKSIISDFENRIKEQGFKLGFTSLYSISDAENLDISKPNGEKNNPSNWQEAVYVNSNKIVLEPSSSKAKIVSFYSYKGGVGRTVALIQTAYILAQAGKRVLLVDLDIEAPGLSENFKAETERLKYGLVDYLYERMFQEEHKISAVNICAKAEQLNVGKTLDGDVYVIPAGKLSEDYIAKLTQLQTTIISEKSYFKDLLNHLVETFHLDYVFIDSRTGLNAWGAFSLLNVSDQVLCFAYPNEENVEGLKLIYNIMRKLGDKSVTFVFSRYEKEKESYVMQLFNQLGLGKQEFISVEYDKNIANAKELPVMNALPSFEEIAQYIMEDKKILRNEDFITKKTDIELVKSLQGENRPDHATSVEYKIADGNNPIIVAEQSAIDYLREYMNRPEINMGVLEKENAENHSVFERKMDAHVRRILERYQGQEIDWSSIWHTYVYCGIRYFCNKEEIEFDEFSSLLGKFTNIEAVEIEQMVDACIDHLRVDVSELFRGNRKELLISPLIMFIKDIEWISEDNIEVGNWIKGLLEVIEFYKQMDRTEIQIKVFLQRDFYIKNADVFSQYQGLILEAKWLKGDINEAVLKWLYSKSSVMIQEYVEQLSVKRHNVSAQSKRVKIVPKNIHNKSIDYEIYNNECIELLLGIRTDNKVYSKKMIDWFYEQLNSDQRYSLAVFEILEKALKFEMEGIAKGNIMKRDRIISMESLELAIKSL